MSEFIFEHISVLKASIVYLHFYFQVSVDKRLIVTENFHRLLGNTQILAEADVRLQYLYSPPVRAIAERRSHALLYRRPITVENRTARGVTPEIQHTTYI